MTTATFTGFIYRDEDGIFVSHCNELDIDTCADSLEEVRELTPKMIAVYLEAAQELGMLSAVQK